MSDLAVRLTKRTVDAEKAGADRFVWDSELAGFGLRVRGTGRKAFVAQYRVHGGRGGKQRRLTLGTYPTLTVDEARQRAKEALAQARMGVDPAEKRDAAREGETVADLVALWRVEGAHINRRTGEVRTPENLARDFAMIDTHILPLLGTKRLSELQRADVERFRDKVTAGATAGRRKTKPRGVSQVRGGAGVATRVVILLSSIFSFGVDRGLLADNPKRGVRSPPGRKMQRFLSVAELGRMGEALAAAEAAGAHPYGVAIIRLLALTGARKSEIVRLRWREVDAEHGLLRLETSKTGAKLVRLPPAALALLQSIARTSSEYVFPGSRLRPAVAAKVDAAERAPFGATPYGGLGKVWNDVRKRAGLDVRLHDLRHTMASFGAAAGFGLPVIGALLGHRNPSTTARYSHLADDPVRAAGDRIGDEIGAALGLRVVA